MIPLLAAVLVFVAAAVATALALVLPGGRGLDPQLATVALSIGFAAGLAAFFHTRRLPTNRRPPARISPWAWVMFAVFAMFALRTFCWLIYPNDLQIVVGSPNNLGDISLHLQLARDFANGIHWWPRHPQASGFSMRYYPGIDLFQSLLLLLDANEYNALVWVGLGGSFLTLIALYRWGGSFAIAGFLFSGGLAGFKFLHEWHFADYQADMAWKSLPLSIFVTQRPFLFALPAGLLLLAHWREKFFPEPPVSMYPLRDADDPRAAASATAPGMPPDARPTKSGLIPFWVELLLYAILPIFHLFTFVFVSALLGWWFVCYIGRPAMRWHLLALVLLALAPGTLEISLMTARFSAAGGIWFEPGWMQHDSPFLAFWIGNFGMLALLAPALWLRSVWDVGHACYVRVFEVDPRRNETAFLLAREEDLDAAFVLPAGVLFLAACFVMMAPWDWDNTKVMLWCYLTALPFIWQRWVRPLAIPLRLPLCVLLFFSGFVSLFGGMGHEHLGYKLIDRAELDGVSYAVRNLPPEARFATAADSAQELEYNHPLVYCGRNVAVGYQGHLHSQGIVYEPILDELDTLMRGQAGWEKAATHLGVRYVYWGPREQRRYPDSPQPWAALGAPIARGDWGAIYDLQPARAH